MNAIVIILAIAIYTFLFFALRAIWQEWRYEKAKSKRYGCE